MLGNVVMIMKFVYVGSTRKINTRISISQRKKNHHLIPTKAVAMDQ